MSEAAEAGLQQQQELMCGRGLVMVKQAFEIKVQ